MRSQPSGGLILVPTSTHHPKDPMPDPLPTRTPSRFVRLARACNAHRWRTFGAWLLALVVIQVIGSSVGVKEISSFRLPGTESQRAYDLLAEHFPAAKGDTDQVVFRARTGTLKDPAAHTRIEAALKGVAADKAV